MKSIEFFIIIILIISVIIFIKISHKDVIYTVSILDNKEYLVQDSDDKDKAVNILATLTQNIIIIKNHLDNHKNDKYKDYKPYIEQLCTRLKNCEISENSPNSSYTSYSVNKGEEIVFCIRSKKNANQLHDINLLMYVTLHEISHVACPEEGHTVLFKKIFAFFTDTAIKLGLYTKINFNENPVEYCGIMITDSII